MKATCSNNWTTEICLLTTATTRAVQSTFVCREGFSDCNKNLSVAFTSTPHCTPEETYRIIRDPYKSHSNITINRSIINISLINHSHLSPTQFYSHYKLQLDHPNKARKTLYLHEGVHHVNKSPTTGDDKRMHSNMGLNHIRGH